MNAGILVRIAKRVPRSTSDEEKQARYLRRMAKRRKAANKAKRMYNGMSYKLMSVRTARRGENG